MKNSILSSDCRSASSKMDSVGSDCLFPILNKFEPT